MKLFILSAAAVLIAGHAVAADLTPLKAPLRAPIFYGGSGAYCGAGAGGEATKVSGTGVATYEAGGLLNFNCGYTAAWGPDRWWALQANYAYANTAGNTPCGLVRCAVDRRQSADIKFMYGAPLTALTGLFSNASAAFPALPPIPPGAINNTMHPYIAVGARVEREHNSIIAGLVDEQRTKVKGLLGVGAMYQTNTNTTINTSVDWTFGSGRFLLVPGAEIKEGSTFRFNVTLNYGLGG